LELTKEFLPLETTTKEFEKVQERPIPSRKYLKGDKSIVAMVRAPTRREGIEECFRLLGGIEKAFETPQSEMALLKPNLNSPDPYPWSTHLETIALTTEQLKKVGITKCIIGDGSGMANHYLTRKIMSELDYIPFAESRNDVELACFEELDWYHMAPEKATHWNNGFIIAKKMYDIPNIISMPTCKTHMGHGEFTISLKETVGCIHPKNRKELHTVPNIQDWFPEICLAYYPKLVIMDAEQCLNRGDWIQPERKRRVHEVKSPRLMIIGDDRVAIDAVGCAILKAMGSGRLLYKKVRDYEQLIRGGELGLGVDSVDKIILKTSNLTDDRDFLELEEEIKHLLYE